MFGSSNGGANAYAKVGLETGVTTANPHKLIVMLFDGALIAVSNAMQHMKSGNIPAKGLAISKAIRIIDGGLRASLDKEAGGDIGKNLDALYEYMGYRLVHANARNQLDILEEVYRLLHDLKEAWEAIGTSEEQPAASRDAAVPPQAPKTSSYDALEPSTSRLVKA